MPHLLRGLRLYPMAIIIGDIHGDLPLAQAFLAYEPEEDHVALGDYVDSRDPKVPFAEELACLELLIESGSVLLWGNHDLAYTPEHPWKNYCRFGVVADLEVQCWTTGNDYLSRLFTQNGALYYADIFESRYHVARAKGQIKAVYAADDWLCSHAGVSTALTAALPGCPWDSENTSAIAAWLNAEFEREFTEKCFPWHQSLISYGSGPLFCIHWTRGGGDRYGGIFWYDPEWELRYPPDPWVKQIFGHTGTAGPMRKKNHINIHIDDGWWCFNTKTSSFVKLIRHEQTADAELTGSGREAEVG